MRDDPLANFNAYNRANTLAELQEAHRIYAKRSNSRLLRLERTRSEITGESYADYGAAQIAYNYLEQQGGAMAKMRFSESPNIKDIEMLKADITAMQTFLSYKSSTVAGQKDAEAKRVAKFASGNWGNNTANGKSRIAITQATNKEFYDFLGSKTYKDLLKQFTSEELIELYQTVHDETDKEEEEILEAFDEYREQRGKKTFKSLKNKILKEN